jgi:Flp pilus assembly protein TadG
MPPSLSPLRSSGGLKMKSQRPLRARRGARGQAMVEYSFINFLLIMMLVIGMSVPIFPNKKNVLEIFLDAYQIYYDSFYFVLNMPFP